jgi:general secretion pathway protein D
MNRTLPCIAALLIAAPATLSAQQARQTPFGQAITAGEGEGAVSVLISGPVTLVSPQDAGAAGAQAAGDPTPVDDRIRTVNILTLVADIADLVDKEIIVDPRARNATAYIAGDEAADYETLRAALRMANWFVMETDNQIRIVPDAQMRAEPTPVLQEDDRRVSDHEVVTRIIPVEGLEATQLIPILRPMMSQSAQLGAAQGSNGIIIVDRYDNVRRIARVIEEVENALAE